MQQLCLCQLNACNAGEPARDDLCAYHAHFDVAALDATFPNLYREHMFRYSKLVPPSLSRYSNSTFPLFTFGLPSTKAIQLESINGTANSTIISSALAAYSNSQLISFVDLYDLDIQLDGEMKAEFDTRWASALKPSRKKQF
jgi:hypothetical protein